ncbi:transcriptional regulator [Kaistia dalseonensis]|uniref:Transcriptional regulator n=1 Tax=Kaistia dalseonensis TaxID=410840 RepID=A0ABU0H908_9HYPH|nr:transcriptional regulator [Kaistia dalseonensis]MCX5495890.1 transcriptional regulator [Kaistia dalseonensis]MDQ0438492.1 putative transcriptional regulator [Kaistia dalseonensis]
MSHVGDDLVEAFEEMASYMRGESQSETYEVPAGLLTPDRIRTIRRSVASSTKAFEAEFHIPARTIEAYEQGRRRPDAATTLLLRLIETDPDAVRRAASGTP